ncbi:four-carbon acid sugar kinase family protein [Subtercola boreus]|uniref:Hydroxyacid dehydrogenase n=1 Tax=Subtercola boreus TaxID=120213 RepID=A0A3E0WGB0_9MICO|nr:four-carbon acid sugar kinase family protein [Subtercola boreus]RFA23530.1 hypothetical protein B7R24_01190 [Subtercola boreus]RFA23924.1 hypothetical protein B7R23_01190 [Subtercola boreus]RFA29623.1 hypothetical protein B7R25_01185 [Subtercola boreus]
MTTEQTVSTARSVAELLQSAPEPRVVPDARSSIRAANRSAGSWVIVLDDDPTGTQAVHGIPVLTRWSDDDLRWAFGHPTHGFFILTNTRGLNDAEAKSVVQEIAAAIARTAAAGGQRYTLITRSDSTLRGHYPLETDVLADLARTAGEPFDALLLAPAYIAAGRVTADDTHFVTVGETVVPVGETNYARDATFGFRSSNLADYVEEKSAGAIVAADVRSLTLDDIRTGGPERVRDILLSCSDGVPVIVNALADSDLDIVALGLVLAEEAGARVLCRTGPSFVAARLGVADRGPLSHAEIFAAGDRAGHGLIVVGSHVELTSRQVATLMRDVPAIASVELDVPRLLDAASAAREVERCTLALVEALRESDAMLVSSRQEITGDSGHSSLVIAQAVSKALVEATENAVAKVDVAWVLAKGGITSSDVATDGLRIERAEVVGQLFPGIVSVWLNDSAEQPRLSGLPYVVFAGNVGDGNSLARAVELLRGDAL